MLHSKVTRNGQITIPKALREEVGIDEGDFVELVRVSEGILLKPKRMQLVDLSNVDKREDKSLLAQYHMQYETIMQLFEGAERDKELAELMDIIKHAFDVPLVQTPEWEKEHKAVIALYRIVSESRTTL